MAITYNKDKRSGLTYAYETTYVWDKEKKQSRSKRTLIGRLDESTGEIVSTDGRGRKRSPNYVPAEDDYQMPKTVKELTAGTYVDKDKVIPNSRVKTGKKKGGQPGHKKHTLTHPATEDISETVEHTLESCPKCGGNLKYIGERHKDVVDYKVTVVTTRAEYFADIRTYLETCYRNNVNSLRALSRLSAGNPYTLAELLGEA